MEVGFDGSYFADCPYSYGSYGIWSDGSYERRQHSIGLVLIHDTHHDVNVEL